MKLKKSGNIMSIVLVAVMVLTVGVLPASANFQGGSCLTLYYQQGEDYNTLISGFTNMYSRVEDKNTFEIHKVGQH